jgi:argininosuccinate synthase
LGRLRYDFYLTTYNLFIEYQGQQHYEPIRFNGIKKEKALKLFIKQQINFEKKKKFAVDNNISLLEIKYDSNIIEVLKKYVVSKSYFN